MPNQDDILSSAVSTMSQRPPDQSDLTPTWPQLVAEVSQAADSVDLDRRASLALMSIVPSSRHELTWATDDGGPGPGEPAILARLRAGVVITGRAGQPGYIPVRCGQQLDGWIRITPGRWSAPQEQALIVLAAVLGATRRTLRPADDPAASARRQLRAEIAQARDTRRLGDLLEQINRVAQRAFGQVSFLVALRYQESSWIEMVYIAISGSRIGKQSFWEQRAGLTGTILQTEEPIFTDSYIEECARQNVPPLYISAGPETHAWMGAPLRDGDRAYGVISCYSHDPAVQFSPLQRELLLILVEEMARPIRNAQMLRLAEQQARQMQALNRITRAITSTLDPERVPALIIEQAQELFNAEEGSLLLLDEETGELVFSYAGGPAGHRLLGQRLPSGTGVAGYVATSGQPAVVNNARGDGRFYGALDGDTGFLTRSLLAVPLRGLDGIKGVIEILNRYDDAPFTEEDRALLEAIADQAMIALDNARRFAQIDQTLARRVRDLDLSNDRLRRILRVSNALRVEHNRDDLLSAIAHSVAESAGFRSAIIALVRPSDAGEPHLQRVIAAGPAAASFEELRPARAPISRLLGILRPEFRRSPSTYVIDRRFDDYVHLWGGPEYVYTSRSTPATLGGWHPRDVMFSLLRNMRGEILGLISVSDPEDGMLPGPEQVQILDIFANQAAVALENAQLYSDLQHSLSSLTALNGLGMALNTTLRTPQEIYDLTVGGMVAQSDARWGQALLWQPQRSPDSLILGSQVGGGPADQTAVEQLAREAIVLRRPQSLRPSPITGEAVVAIPLRATRGILGAICIGYTDILPRASAIESLGLFAGQAAVAAESLQLFGAVRQGRDQLASIMASTREGMLLVDESGSIAVANDAFRELADVAAWPAGGDLAGLLVVELLTRWQTTAHYDPADLEQLYDGLSGVADGVERFVRGQLTSPRSGPPALEWSVTRAIPEGEHGGEGERTPHRWPILLTVRDITAAKEAERLRQDLTNMMVHDLRSPLTSVITSIDMIFRGVAGGEANKIQREILGIAYTSTQHLLDMVNLLLDISRLESGQMPLDCAPVALRPLGESAISRMTIIAQKNSVAINLDVADESLRVHADHELLLRVLQNLLDNALKFSPKASQVIMRIGPAETNGHVRVAVRDFGLGIKPHDLDKIFSKFGQAGNRRTSGSGLGLTFCKLVVEAHGGTIGVESVPGEGSTFFFTLPAAEG
ncbi:GAF domain-containing protein [Oscillochloris sp. ZM17-4]|uniref:GAF domain-containing protein n=1 Tax=Oscillochloris sp. ZM17-4 TaxID=2866714 RepID=UPI001C73253A|nr:GAF domain-containing protein [Oscillochloris sp. ZM17-4]MBX0327970.1 GAF domain-containing protein [Oscillochloris sp. ZM17-4]